MMDYDSKEERSQSRYEEKIIRHSSNIDFLSICLKKEMIPKGFRLKWMLNAAGEKDILEKCEKVKADASFKLMELSIETNQRNVKKLKEVTGIIDNFDTAKHADLQRRLYQRKSNKLKHLINESSLNAERVLKEYKVANVRGDGNCFYRCIAKWMYKDEDRHGDIRREVINHLSANKEVYRQFVDGDMDEHLEQQLMTDGRVTSWATEAEIFATAGKYGMTINVHVKSRVQKFEPLIENPSDKVVHVQLENDHFDLLMTNEHGDTEFKTPRGMSYNWFEMKNCDAKGVNEKPATEGKVTTDPINENLVQAGGLKKNKTGNASNNHVVTNLSSRKLSKAELDLLSKGFSFIPTRKKVNVWKIQSDLTEWERRMRLREYFMDKEEEGEESQRQEEENEVWNEKKKSNFTPNPGRDKLLDAYIEAVKKDVVDGVKGQIDMNFSKSEEGALQSLLSDNSIIVRPADKGSGIVVMNTDQYIEGLEKEMSESISYVQTDNERYMYALSEKMVKKKVDEMYKEGLINADIRKYLILRYSRPGQLKGNPKLHKKEKPLRTIVNGISTPTEKMAQLAERELNEYVLKTPSYIKDTTDFLNHLESSKDDVPKDPILFCFDVVKLYPSIPKKEGLQACKVALDSRKRKKVDTSAVMQMIETVLENNIFNFINKSYHQKEGVAIGSRLGRNFACAYMRTWDEELVKYPLQPFMYKRFIDDGFGIWEHGEKALEDFYKYANSIHPNIKVELRSSPEKIEFLDTLVLIDNGRIETDLYTKPTDKHIYVQRKSNHPNSVKKSLPYGLALRIKRICSRKQDYLRHRAELKLQLRKRGYSSKFLEGQLGKVDQLDRQNLLHYRKQKPKDKLERVPLVITYANHLPDVQKITRQHLEILHKSERMKTLFKSPPIVAFRRDRNLADILVHGKHNKIFKDRQDSIDSRCQLNKCQICKIMTRDHALEGHGLRIQDHQSCKIWNVVYGIRCDKCERIVYVGETERSLGERLKEHLADVRHKRPKPVSQHFNEEKHSISNFKIVILEKCSDASKYYRKIREVFWIERLNTVKPSGLNTKSPMGVLWPDY